MLHPVSCRTASYVTTEHVETGTAAVSVRGPVSFYPACGVVQLLVPWRHALLPDPSPLPVTPTSLSLTTSNHQSVLPVIVSPEHFQNGVIWYVAL